MSKPGSQHAYRLVCPSRIQRFQCVIGLGEQTAAVVSRLCRDAGVEVRAEYRNGKIGFVIDSDSFGGALVVGLMEILGEKPEFDEKKCKQCKTHPVVSPFRVFARRPVQTAGSVQRPCTTVVVHMSDRPGTL